MRVRLVDADYERTRKLRWLRTNTTTGTSPRVVQPYNRVPPLLFLFLFLLSFPSARFFRWGFYERILRLDQPTSSNSSVDFFFPSFSLLSFFFLFLICEKPSVTEYSYALRIYIYGRKFLRNKKIELLFYIFLLSFLSTDRWNDSDGIWKNNNSIVIFAKKFVSSTRDLEKDLSRQKELGWGRNERRKTIGIFRNKYTRET